MCGNTRRDMVRNVNILTKIRVAPIEEKMRETVSDGLVMSNVHLQIRSVASRAYQLRVS